MREFYILGIITILCLAAIGCSQKHFLSVGECDELKELKAYKGNENSTYLIWNSHQKKYQVYSWQQKYILYGELWVIDDGTYSLLEVAGYDLIRTNYYVSESDDQFKLFSDYRTIGIFKKVGNNIYELK